MNTIPEILTAAVLPHGNYWAVEDTALAAYLEVLQGVDLAAHSRDWLAAAPARTAANRDRIPYTIREDGVATLSVSGVMTRDTNSMQAIFGGTSTVQLRQDLRAAATDPAVKAVFLGFHTPGGDVHGTNDLGKEIARTAAIKPVYGYAPDLCASAGLWAASQCTKFYAGETAQIGSIGTVRSAVDSSRAAQNDGLTVHNISTGQFKGAGMPGTAITAAHLADFQRTAEDLNAHFKAAVSAGRNMTPQAVDAIADGRMFIAKESLALGLIDGIASLDEVLSQMSLLCTSLPTTEKPTMSLLTKARALLGMEPLTAEAKDAAAVIDEAATADIAALNAQHMSDLAAKASEIGAKDAEIARLKAQQDQDAKDQAEAETARLETENAAAVDSLVEDFKIVPAAQASAITLRAASPEAFDAFAATLEVNPALAGSPPPKRAQGKTVKGEQAEAGQRGAPSSVKRGPVTVITENASLADAATAHMAEHNAKATSKDGKISYSQALRAVSLENPGLTD